MAHSEIAVITAASVNPEQKMVSTYIIFKKTTDAHKCIDKI